MGGRVERPPDDRLRRRGGLGLLRLLLRLLGLLLLLTELIELAAADLMVDLLLLEYLLLLRLLLPLLAQDELLLEGHDERVLRGSASVTYNNC